MLLSPCSVLSTAQFASLSLLIASPIVPSSCGSRGETIVVAAPNSFVRQDSFLACLDELHNKCVVQQKRSNNDNNDNGVIVDMYRTQRRNGMELYYTLISNKEIIQSCIQFLSSNNTQTTNMAIQGIVICVGVSGSNHFYSVMIDELPFRLRQTLQLLPKIFTRTDTTNTTTINNNNNKNSSGQKQQKYLQDFLSSSSSLLGDSSLDAKTKGIKILLASLIMEEEEEDDNIKTTTITQRTALGSNTRNHNDIIIMDYLRTNNKATNCRMEAERMEVMAIHDDIITATIPTKPAATKQRQQHDSIFYARNTNSMNNNNNNNNNTPSLHGFDYTTPLAKIPIAIVTTTPAQQHQPQQVVHVKEDIHMAQQQQQQQQHQQSSSSLPKFKIGTSNNGLTTATATTLYQQQLLASRDENSSEHSNPSSEVTTITANALGQQHDTSISTWNISSTKAKATTPPTTSLLKQQQQQQQGIRDDGSNKDYNDLSFTSQEEVNNATNTTPHHNTIVSKSYDDDDVDSTAPVTNNNTQNHANSTTIGTAASTNYDDNDSIDLLSFQKLVVSVAVNEDVVCSYQNSKLLHCHVNGLLQLQANSSSTSSSSTPFVIIIKDPSQHINAIKASKEYAVKIIDEDTTTTTDTTSTNFMYFVDNIPHDRFVPVFKYKCNDDTLCPIPLRIQMKSRLVPDEENRRLRISLQLSSNPEMNTQLSDLDVIIMNIPDSIVFDNTSPPPNKGGSKFLISQQGSTVSWRIPKLGIGDKIQSHVYFLQNNQEEEEEEVAASIPLQVMVRCIGLYSQLSNIRIRIRNASSTTTPTTAARSGDADEWQPPVDVRMKLARRFRVIHQEQDDAYCKS